MSESNGANGSTNGVARTDEKVRVAIVGVGNCANSFIQGVQYYKDADPAEEVPGLMHVDLGGYHVRDVEFVAAFDIDSEKVGKDLSEAIWSGQNDTIKFADVPNLGVKVERGMTHDGLGKYLKEKITKAPGETADIVGILKETKADVLVCYLPVGSEDATKWYVEQALDGRASASSTACPSSSPARTTGTSASKRPGCRSSATTSSPRSGRRSSTASSPASSTTAACGWSGPASSTSAATWTSTTCSSASGSTRRRSRRPTRSPRSWATSCPTDNVHVGPSDYVPWLTDRKWAHIRLEGKAFGDVPLTAELKLEVWDSPNSAGVVIDAVRLIKLALNNGIAGQLDGPSSYLMKSPHSQRPDDEAREQTEEFIAANARGKAAAPRRRRREHAPQA